MRPVGRNIRLSSKARAGTMLHLKLTFPEIFSPANPRARLSQVINILDQVCKQYKKQQHVLPQFSWKSVSVTSRELKTILRTKPAHDDPAITQRGDVLVIHAGKKTFGKRYTLQIYPDGSSISLAVAGSWELYDLLIDLNQDGNLLASHKALHRRKDGRKTLIEMQLVTMPSGYHDNYMYSVSYRRPLRRCTTSRLTLLKAMQQLSLTPELYAVDANSGNKVEKMTDAEFEKIFGVKLMRRLSVADSDNIESDLKNIHSSYRRLQPYIDGHLEYDAGIKNGSLQDVSQDFLLDNILAQAKKKQFLPRVVVVRVSDLVGYGLVAGENIPAGAIIGEYCGQITKVSSAAMDNGKNQLDNTYFAAYAPDEVPGSEMFVVDARKAGNSTRFINHSDENSNATWAHVFDGKWFRPVIAAVKPIPEGKQILLKYKDSYWSAKRNGSTSHLPNTPYPLE